MLESISVAGPKVLIHRHGGKFYATSPTCCHYGAPLSKGVRIALGPQPLCQQSWATLRTVRVILRLTHREVKEAGMLSYGPERFPASCDVFLPLFAQASKQNTTEHSASCKLHWQELLLLVASLGLGQRLRVLCTTPRLI
eukprot:5166579-Amphidinium_carterae.1